MDKIKNIFLQKKKSILIFAGLFIFLGLISGFFYHKYNAGATTLHENSKIGLITDIHAGNEKERIIEGVTMGYPRVYKEHFSAALDEMKKQGINLVIALGDNTNEGNEKKAQTLVDIAKNKNMEIVWVKGNHDREETNVMNVFGVQSPYYYYVDKGDWRIVVLDSSEIDPAGTGGIDPQQLDWLKNILQTDKSVVVAMHHPIYDEQHTDQILSVYSDFKNVLEKAGNVRYVLSGHWHTQAVANISNGITYKTIKSLTLDENVPNFEILTLQK
jgi:3',5'-cyclic AMP phosphodiesterase CpdA